MENQAGTATIVVLARWGFPQGSALRTGQGDGPPMFFRQRSPIGWHNLLFSSAMVDGGELQAKEAACSQGAELYY